MSKLKPNFYRLTGLMKTNTYIETGTYYGINLNEVANEYAQIYSIEIENKWIEYNKKKFEGFQNINLIEGDSTSVLIELCKEINNASTFFLDAHYSGEGTGYKNKTSPIISELESIFNRHNYKDIVIIDDTRLFGKISVEGSDDHPYYKKAVLDWRSITLDNVLNKIPKEWTVLKNTKNSLSFGKDDQLIVCNISDTRKFVIVVYQLLVTIGFKMIHLKKIIRHYFFYFLKLLIPNNIYKKLINLKR